MSESPAGGVGAGSLAGPLVVHAQPARAVPLAAPVAALVLKKPSTPIVAKAADIVDRDDGTKNRTPVVSYGYMSGWLHPKPIQHRALPIPLSDNRLVFSVDPLAEEGSAAGAGAGASSSSNFQVFSDAAAADDESVVAGAETKKAAKAVAKGAGRKTKKQKPMMTAKPAHFQVGPPPTSEKDARNRAPLQPVHPSMLQPMVKKVVFDWGHATSDIDLQEIAKLKTDTMTYVGQRDVPSHDLLSAHEVRAAGGRPLGPEVLRSLQHRIMAGFENYREPTSGVLEHKVAMQIAVGKNSMFGQAIIQELATRYPFISHKKQQPAAADIDHADSALRDVLIAMIMRYWLIANDRFVQYWPRGSGFYRDAALPFAFVLFNSDLIQRSGALSMLTSSSDAAQAGLSTAAGLVGEVHTHRKQPLAKQLEREEKKAAKALQKEKKRQHKQEAGSVRVNSFFSSTRPGTPDALGKRSRAAAGLDSAFSAAGAGAGAGSGSGSGPGVESSAAAAAAAAAAAIEDALDAPSPSSAKRRKTAGGSVPGDSGDSGDSAVQGAIEQAMDLVDLRPASDVRERHKDSFEYAIDLLLGVVTVLNKEQLDKDAELVRYVVGKRAVSDVDCREAARLLSLPDFAAVALAQLYEACAAGNVRLPLPSIPNVCFYVMGKQWDNNTAAWGYVNVPVAFRDVAQTPLAEEAKLKIKASRRNTDKETKFTAAYYLHYGRLNITASSTKHELAAIDLVPYLWHHPMMSPVREVLDLDRRAGLDAEPGERDRLSVMQQEISMWTGVGHRMRLFGGASFDSPSQRRFWPVINAIRARYSVYENGSGGGLWLPPPLGIPGSSYPGDRMATRAASGYGYDVSENSFAQMNPAYVQWIEATYREPAKIGFLRTVLGTTPEAVRGMSADQRAELASAIAALRVYNRRQTHRYPPPAALVGTKDAAKYANLPLLHSRVRFGDPLHYDETMFARPNEMQFGIVFVDYTTGAAAASAGDGKEAKEAKRPSHSSDWQPHHAFAIQELVTACSPGGTLSSNQGVGQLYRPENSWRLPLFYAALCCLYQFEIDVVMQLMGLMRFSDPASGGSQPSAAALYAFVQRLQSAFHSGWSRSQEDLEADKTIFPRCAATMAINASNGLHGLGTGYRGIAPVTMAVSRAWFPKDDEKQLPSDSQPVLFGFFRANRAAEIIAALGLADAMFAVETLKDARTGTWDLLSIAQWSAPRPDGDIAVENALLQWTRHGGPYGGPSYSLCIRTALQAVIDDFDAVRDQLARFAPGSASFDGIVRSPEWELYSSAYPKHPHALKLDAAARVTNRARLLDRISSASWVAFYRDYLGKVVWRLLAWFVARNPMPRTAISVGSSALEWESAAAELRPKGPSDADYARELSAAAAAFQGRVAAATERRLAAKAAPAALALSRVVLGEMGGGGSLHSGNSSLVSVVGALAALSRDASRPQTVRALASDLMLRIRPHLDFRTHAFDVDEFASFGSSAGAGSGSRYGLGLGSGSGSGGALSLAPFAPAPQLPALLLSSSAATPLPPLPPPPTAEATASLLAAFASVAPPPVLVQRTPAGGPFGSAGAGSSSSSSSGSGAGAGAGAGAGGGQAGFQQDALEAQLVPTTEAIASARVGMDLSNPDDDEEFEPEWLR